jgi:hypothetical protein
VYTCDNVFGPVAARWKEDCALFGRRWRVGRAHYCLQGLVVGFIRGAETAVLTSELVSSEFFEIDDAFSYFGEEGRVCGESVERVLTVVDGIPWDE